MRFEVQRPQQGRSIGPGHRRERACLPRGHKLLDPHPGQRVQSGHQLADQGETGQIDVEALVVIHRGRKVHLRRGCWQVDGQQHQYDWQLSHHSSTLRSNWMGGGDASGILTEPAGFLYLIRSI